MDKGFLYIFMAVAFIRPCTCFSQEIKDPCVKTGYNLGMQAFNDQNYEEAIKWFRKAAGCPAASAAEKNTVNEKIDLAYDKIMEGDLKSASKAFVREDYDLALEYCEKVKNNPRCFEEQTNSADHMINRCHLKKGLLIAAVKKGKGEYNDAIVLYQKALSNPSASYDEKKAVNLDISECCMRIDLEKANNALSVKDYPTALQYFQKVKDSPAADRVALGYIQSKIDSCKNEINRSFNLNALRTKALSREIEMVYVQGGTFRMGSNDGVANEKPVHTVTVNSFYIGKYEVTQKQWREVMGSDPADLYNKGCDNCPVERVSWNDIQEFISKLNEASGKRYRLPTEAEWEFAARGGIKSRGYPYAGSNTISDVAWYTDNSNSKTHPVGQKAPNELGLYDMSGNVWEWCADSYTGDYSPRSPRSNPDNKMQNSSRILRGGSWDDFPSYCRVACRFNFTVYSRNYDLGFRLIRIE